MENSPKIYDCTPLKVKHQIKLQLMANSAIEWRFRLSAPHWNLDFFHRKIVRWRFQFKKIRQWSNEKWKDKHLSKKKVKNGGVCSTIKIHHHLVRRFSTNPISKVWFIIFMYARPLTISWWTPKPQSRSKTIHETSTFCHRLCTPCTKSRSRSSTFVKSKLKCLRIDRHCGNGWVLV